MRTLFFRQVVNFVLLCLSILYPANGFAQTSADSMWTFDQIRTDTDGDNTLDYLGEEVTVTGIANINSGLLHEHYLQAFIQNDTSGMSIFAMQIDTPFEVGDSLVVRGVIELYNGLAEVHADSYEVFPGVADEPQTRSLGQAIADPREFLGMLVEGAGTIIEKGSTFNGNYIRIAQDDSSQSMMVYVSNFHRLFDDFNFDVLSEGDEVSVKGIVTEYNPEFPQERSYKLFLRTPNDLQYESLPRFYLYLILGGILLIAVIIIVWMVILKSRVESKTAEIKTSLKEKEILLREIHHRVKNSLAIVSSLIELQLHSTESKEAQTVLKSSQTRIHSIALIHDKLYKTESLSKVELGKYIRELVETIHGTFTGYEDAVVLNFDLDTIELDIERVIPCGLLISELVVNAFKHAFSKNKQGELNISLKKAGHEIQLTVSDNGPGLPDDFTLDKDDSLGSMLIGSFADQLDAKMEISDSSEGASFRFTFPIQKDQS